MGAIRVSVSGLVFASGSCGLGFSHLGRRMLAEWKFIPWVSGVRV